MDQVKVLPTNTSMDNLENAINTFITENYEAHIPNGIEIKNVKYINNRYLLIYSEHLIPTRMFGVVKIQKKIDQSIEDLKKILKAFATSSKMLVDNIKIEEFTIYEDHADRARDHMILIYSYDSYHGQILQLPEDLF